MIPRDALPPLDELALIGVSGGRDSVALLDLLAGFDAKLIVCHLDHALRAESAAEAQHAEKLAAKYQLPFVGAREMCRSEPWLGRNPWRRPLEMRVTSSSRVWRASMNALGSTWRTMQTIRSRRC
jgi:hypothetical protein